jgi:hypothetical protein
LICHGCDDVEAVIVGFLIHDQSEQAWALCRSCVQNPPLYGAIARETIAVYLRDR